MTSGHLQQAVKLVQVVAEGCGRHLVTPHSYNLNICNYLGVRLGAVCDDVWYTVYSNVTFLHTLQSTPHSSNINICNSYRSRMQHNFCSYLGVRLGAVCDDDWCTVYSALHWVRPGQLGAAWLMLNIPHIGKHNTTPQSRYCITLTRKCLL